MCKPHTTNIVRSSCILYDHLSHSFDSGSSHFSEWHADFVAKEANDNAVLWPEQNPVFGASGGLSGFGNGSCMSLAVSLSWEVLCVSFWDVSLQDRFFTLNHALESGCSCPIPNRLTFIDAWTEWIIDHACKYLNVLILHSFCKRGACLVLEGIAKQNICPSTQGRAAGRRRRFAGKSDDLADDLGQTHH